MGSGEDDPCARLRLLHLEDNVMAKQKYNVKVEVCRVYYVEISADSLVDAGEKAAKLKANDAEAGEEFDFEINIMGVTKAKRMMYQ